MNLADAGSVKRLLESEGFSFKKSLGQNFLTDKSICPRMALAACGPDTGILEIGAGAGVLTAELAKTARYVVSIELDERLKPILQKTLSEFSNVKLIFGDVMKIDLKTIISENFSDCGSVCVCANLPYYITSPVIMMLLESRLPVDTITVMVQKEAAERLCAEVGSRKAGAVTAAVNYYAESKILFDVSRNCFMPAPNVDSAVIQLKIRKIPPVELTDKQFFFSLIKACFAQRRKTLINTVSNTMHIDKQLLRTALLNIGESENVRAEKLSMQGLAKLSNEILRLK